MGGGEKFSKVLSSLTLKTQQVSSALYTIEPAGKIDISNALKISSLILKNREQKHFGQRIVLFVASPIKDHLSVEDYKAMGTQLKKDNVSLDIISIGEISDNYDKLHALFDAAKREGESSNFLTLAAGTGSLIDVLLCSPMVMQSDNSHAGAGAGGAAAAPSSSAVDEDLAMAMRESMADYNKSEDEELQRVLLESLKEANKANGNPDEEKKPEIVNPPPPPAAPAAPVAGNDDFVFDEDDEELKLALQMSLMDNNDAAVVDVKSEPVSEEGKKMDVEDVKPEVKVEVKMEVEEDKEEVKPEEKVEEKVKVEDKTLNLSDVDPMALLEDPNFVDGILSELGGVNIDEAKKYLGGDVKKEEDDDDDKDKK